MKSANIIIISAHKDAHIPYVQQYLTKPAIVIDPLASLVGASVSFYIDNGTSYITYQGVHLDHINGVWYRKPTSFLDISLDVDPSLRDYSTDAIRQHCALIRNQFLDAVWVSDYYAIRRAHNKSQGLHRAAKLGLQVPDTLFTSNQNEAVAFMSKYPVTIVKSLARTFPLLKDQGATMFFARKIARGEEINLDGLRLAPAVFQKAIEVDYDIRVNVVGSQVFASKITNKGLAESNIRDWRQGHFTGTIHFEAYTELPTGISEKCIRLTKDFGLSFGAIDLVKDKHGTYWFLEINPNGQWAFADDQTVNGVGKSIADLLQSK